jgi:hypothetical protein
VSALVNDADAIVGAFKDARLGEAAASALALPWSPGRTSSPRRAPTGPTGGGGSPARSPGTG